MNGPCASGCACHSTTVPDEPWSYDSDPECDEDDRHGEWSGSTFHTDDDDVTHAVDQTTAPTRTTVIPPTPIIDKQLCTSCGWTGRPNSNQVCTGCRSTETLVMICWCGDIACDLACPAGERQRATYKQISEIDMPGAPTAADGDNHNFGISKHNVFGVRGGMGLPADELPSETPIEDLGVFIDRLLERIGTMEKLDDDIMESLRVLEWDVSEDELMAVGFKPKRLLAALDSGAGDHVAGSEDVMGFKLEESPGSRAGRSFIAANGSKIQNLGQVGLRMRNGQGPVFRSMFQIADVTRPLYSVGRICDAGCTVTFNKAKATVVKDGKTIATFDRQGGLYLADLEILGSMLDDGGTAQPFPRQGGHQ